MTSGGGSEGKRNNASWKERTRSRIREIRRIAARAVTSVRDKLLANFEMCFVMDRMLCRCWVVVRDASH